MNEKINLDVNVLDVIYKKYKKFIPPFGVIAVSVLLFLFIIIPQIRNYFALLGQVNAENQKLLVLKNNQNFLTTLDENKLSDQVKIVSSALPSDKDFMGALYALSAVSAKTGVLLGNYSFDVGELGEKNTGTDLPFSTITIQLNAQVLNTLKFIKELYQTVPLAEVTKINVNQGVSQITIDFYYLSVPASGTLDETVPLSSLTQKQTAMINKLSTWNNATNINPILSLPISAPASASGNPFGE